MHSQKVDVLRKLFHTAMIFCVITLCLSSIGIAFAKYNSESHAQDSANAAMFSPSLLSDDKIDVSGIKKPGDNVETKFSVHNSSDSKASEVTMKYKICLKTTGNLPLTFTLLNGAGNTVATWDCNGTSGNKNYEYFCPNFFSPETNQTHDYELKVEWQDDRKESRFSGMTDAVYLSVTWEQVD